MENTLIDAGPLIALFDKNDTYHKLVKEAEELGRSLNQDEGFLVKDTF